MTEPELHAYPDRELAIIDTFVRLSDTLVADYDVIDFLTFLAERCVELSDADEAAVMIASPSGHLHAVASSSERSRLLELFELQNQDGPCLDAFRTGAVVQCGDLANETLRWPVFTPRAFEVGFRSVHSVPLKLREQVIGALNLLGVRPELLSVGDARLVRSMADIATIGVLQERYLSEAALRASGLQTALTSRIRIEQAKGILSARWSISIDEAFDRMRRFARGRGLRLSSVAESVIANSVVIPGLDD